MAPSTHRSCIRDTEVQSSITLKILPDNSSIGLLGALVWSGAIRLLIGTAPSHAFRRMRQIILYVVVYVSILEMGVLFTGAPPRLPLMIDGLITWILLHSARPRED